MTLDPGTIGLDWSYSRPALAVAYQSGARFVLRYSAGAASDPGHPSHALNAGKLITPTEHAALLAAGFDVIANDEWYESRVTEGSAAGRQDGAAALRLWRSCGHAKGSTIYVSWDQGVSASKFPAVAAYLYGFRAALAGYYKVDLYAGTPALRDMLRRGLIRYGWRPNAGSWSGDGLPYQPDTSTPAKRAALVQQALKATPAHIWQTGNYWFNKSADENVIVRSPVGSHLEALATVKPVPRHRRGPGNPAPVKPPTPGRRPRMIVCTVDRSTIPAGQTWPGYFTFDGRNIAHMTAPNGKVDNVNAVLAGLGQANPVVVTFAQYTSWKAGA